MKVTKYPQSCLLVEVDGVRLLIDPGSFVSQKYFESDLLPVDAILLTHEHADHVDPFLIGEIVGKTAVAVYCNQSTANLIGSLATNIVNDGDRFMVDGVEITAHELPHVTMVDGSDGPQNTGYVIAGTLFHPGDGVEIKGLQIPVVAAPIAGPDVSPRDVFAFVQMTGAKKVIPIHYDYFVVDPVFITNMLGVETIVLKNGESAEI